MNARDEILGRIRAATADIAEKDPAKDVPIDWRYGVGVLVEDVVGTFVERVRDYKATVVPVATDADVPAALAAALPATGVTSSVVVPTGLPQAWREALAGTGIGVAVDDPPLTKTELNEVDAVVTAAAAGIADTGTIVLDHDADQGRRALTLVPDRHICVVRVDQLTGDVPEAMTRLKASVMAHRPLTFISGGSATSDIELSRVDGVHGPRTLYVILVGATE